MFLTKHIEKAHLTWTIYFPSAVTTVSQVFGEGQGPILLDDLQCIGNENSLLSCPNRGVGIHNCTHARDAGVVCAFGNCLINAPTYILHVCTYLCTCMYKKVVTYVYIYTYVHAHNINTGSDCVYVEPQYI